MIVWGSVAAQISDGFIPEERAPVPNGQEDWLATELVRTLPLPGIEYQPQSRSPSLYRLSYAASLTITETTFLVLLPAIPLLSSLRKEIKRLLGMEHQLSEQIITICKLKPRVYMHGRLS
jgi:hypothetical protein